MYVWYLMIYKLEKKILLFPLNKRSETRLPAPLQIHHRIEGVTRLKCFECCCRYSFRYKQISK